MPINNIRHSLDPTGRNPNNLVSNETHVLAASNDLNRIIIPLYGPIFKEGLVIRVEGSSRILVSGEDYITTDLLQDATLTFNKEIVSAIVILDLVFVGTLLLEYQVLGGLYSHTVTPVIDAYNDYENTNAPVDWAQVSNTPDEYPPSLHLHNLNEVYGWGPVSTALERIRNAIVLSDVPAFERLAKWVKNTVESGGSGIAFATPQDIDESVPSDKFITMTTLLYALKQFNFSTINFHNLKKNIVSNRVIDYNLITNNIVNNTTLYWSIRHIGTNSSDFTSNSGELTVRDNESSIRLTTSNVDIEEDTVHSFKIIIRKNSIDGFVLLESIPIIITVNKTSQFINFRTACCLFNPGINLIPESLYLVREY